MTDITADVLCDIRQAIEERLPTAQERRVALVAQIAAACQRDERAAGQLVSPSGAVEAALTVLRAAEIAVAAESHDPEAAGAEFGRARDFSRVASDAD